VGAGAGGYGKGRDLDLTCVRSGPCWAVEPDVTLESAEKVSLGLSSGDVVHMWGRRSLRRWKLVAEAVLDSHPRRHRKSRRPACSGGDGACCP